MKELKDELTYNADPDEVASAILLNFPEYASDVLGFDVEDYLDVSDDDEYDKREEEVIGLIKENLSLILDKVDYNDLVDIADLTDTEIYYKVTGKLSESVMLYNYVYEPRIFDPVTAIKVGLVPFRVSDGKCFLELLALGTIGMDMSPTLDAYQLLVSGSIPRNSMFFRHPDYFKYVVGERVFEEVKEIIERGP